MIRRVCARWRSLVLIAVVMTSPTHAQIGQVSSGFNSSVATATAIAATPACLGWCAIGTCFWLRCTLIGCDVETSLRITHKYPDLVVTAWTNDPVTPGSGNPYYDAALLYGGVTYALGSGSLATLPGVLMGGGNSTPKDKPIKAAENGRVTAGATANTAEQGYQSEQQRHRNLRFKDTMAVGHPLTGANQNLAGLFTSIPALCPSEALPLNLYYSSQADAANWRTGVTDMLNPLYDLSALAPGAFEVGIPIANDYGPLYLRTGFVTQHSDYKAAAIFAQRTVDIVTQPAQLRIYQWLEQPPGIYPIWAEPAPGPALLIDQSWQRITEVPEPFCHSFGIEPDIANPDSGQYGWNYWQKYQCCIEDPGAIFLGFTLENLFCLAL